MYDKEHGTLVQKFAGMIMDMIRGDARDHDSDKKLYPSDEDVHIKAMHKFDNPHHWLPFFPEDMDLIDLIMVVVDSAAGIEQHDSNEVRIPARIDIIEHCPWLLEWIGKTLSRLFPDRALDIEFVPEDEELVKEVRKMM